MSMSFDQYMRDMVQPMRDELTRLGIQELRTPEEVEASLPDAKGTALVVINSVCGCAAGQCRQGLLRHFRTILHRITCTLCLQVKTKEATAKAREFFAPYPPSSPSIALLKDGELVHFIERHQVEDRSAEEIAADLTSAFERYCR